VITLTLQCSYSDVAIVANYHYYISSKYYIVISAYTHLLNCFAGKAARVKQARTEVDDEIARYKAQMDLECKTLEDDV